MQRGVSLDSPFRPKDPTDLRPFPVDPNRSKRSRWGIPKSQVAIGLIIAGLTFGPEADWDLFRS